MTDGLIKSISEKVLDMILNVLLDLIINNVNVT